jgi:hypothetical protein
MLCLAVVAHTTYHSRRHGPVIRTKRPIAKSCVDAETEGHICDNREGNDRAGELRRMVSVIHHIVTLMKNGSQWHRSEEESSSMQVRKVQEMGGTNGSGARRQLDIKLRVDPESCLWVEADIESREDQVI